jgi:hypothetical protein
MDEDSYRAASFLDQRALRAGYRIEWSDWPALAAAMPLEARRDAQYIFHIGNVGSTLISRLLGELDAVLALREPLLLRSFAERPPAADRFDTLTALLSRTFRPGQRAIVKATSFTNEIADRLLPPQSHALFLYAAPDRYLENILAGQNSWQTLEALSPIRLTRLQSRCPGLDLDLERASDAVKAALGWACEMTSLERAAAALPAGSVLWLDFDLFLSDTVRHFIAIAGHFGLALPAGAARAICEGPLMQRYSKALEYEYSPELRRQILEEARWTHRAAIRAAVGWLEDLAGRYPACARAMRRGAGETIGEAG